MILAFELSMPNNNSWNGNWSGEGKLYVRVEKFNSKKAAQAILDKGYFSYDFGDGWRAGISVNEVNASEAAKLRRQSKGFCGYDWMIQSIRNKGMIECPKN